MNSFADLFVIVLVLSALYVALGLLALALEHLPSYLDGRQRRAPQRVAGNPPARRDRPRRLGGRHRRLKDAAATNRDASERYRLSAASLP
ncbi:MAG: hypothetical protein WBG92_07510 [Thiohalocapsa sp.]